MDPSSIPTYIVHPFNQTLVCKMGQISIDRDQISSTDSSQQAAALAERMMSVCVIVLPPSIPCPLTTRTAAQGGGRAMATPGTDEAASAAAAGAGEDFRTSLDARELDSAKNSPELVEQHLLATKVHK